MLTLSDYDATGGNAAKIYVERIADVKILNASAVDVTSALVAAGILVGEASDDDAIVETFGEDWADVARYALGIKTNPDVPL